MTRAQASRRRRGRGRHRGRRNLLPARRVLSAKAQKNRAMSLLNKQKEAAEPDVSTFPVSQAVRSSPRVISRGRPVPRSAGLKACFA